MKKKLTSTKFVLLLIFIANLLFVFYTNTISESTFFTKWIDPMFTITTGILALFIWILDIKNGWRNSRPQKLTVHVKYRDNYVYTCHKASLSGVSDIRPWGQQIAKQMNDNKNLDFYPYMDIDTDYNPKDEYITYNHYILTIYLSKSPNDFYKIWWENDQRSIGNKEYISPTQPPEPLTIDKCIERLHATNHKPE